MKNIHVNSKKYFNETILNILKRQSGWFLFFFFLISFSVNAQITRTQIINNATPYTSFAWFANSCNLWSGTFCSGANIYCAPWVTTGTNISMPYCWGGWSTQSEYNTAMSGCKSAGQVCSSGGGGCTGLPSAPLTCAGGHDCSGFVTRAWGLTMKYSTSTLPNISTSIASSAVQPGDIFNIVGSHTRLVETNNGGTITVMEASGTDWKTAYHTYTPAQLSSYDPRCYNNVIGGCSVASVVCNNDDCLGAVTLTSNASCINTSCSVDNATSDFFTVPSCDAFSGTILGAGVFFAFTPTTTATYTITVDPTGTLDALIVVYSGNCFNLLEIPGGCMDTPGGVGVTTILNVTLNSGVPYTIRVYDYGATAPPIGSGGFDICITNSCTPPTVPTSISVSPQSTICSGNSVTLTKNGGSTGTNGTWEWYSGSCGGSYVGSGASVSVSPSSNTTYYVRGEGCSTNTSCASTTITVNTPSVAASGINASQNTICQGNSTSLSVSGGSLGTGASWQWYSGSCGGTSVGTGSSINVSPSSTTTYFVRAESGGVCPNTSCASTTITVNSPSVAASGINASQNTICQGNSTSLSVSGGSLGTGASWQWYSGSCGGTSVGTGSSINVSPSSTITYYVRAADATGVCPNTSCVSLTINVETPSTISGATISVNPDTICSQPQGTATLTVNGGSLGTNANWSWYTNNCGGTAAGSGNSINVSPPSTTYYYVQAISSSGVCPATSCINNAVGVDNPSIPLVNTNGVTMTCTNYSSNLQWYYNGGQISGATSNPYTATQNGTYYVIYTNPSTGCYSQSANIIITSVGITEFSDGSTISIYPNPTNGFINIKLNGLSNENYKLVLRNTLGQTLNEKVFNATNNSIETRFDMKDLSSGIYFLDITSNKINQTFKVQKQ